MGLATLKDYLSDWTLDGRTRSHVADTVLALAETSIRISELVARGSLGGRLGQIVSKAGEFDEQKEIDLLTNGMIAEALKAAGGQPRRIRMDQTAQPIENVSARQ